MGQMLKRLPRTPSVPLVSRIAPADLVRLCPACDRPLDDSPSTSNVDVQSCAGCGLGVITPRRG